MYRMKVVSWTIPKQNTFWEKLKLSNITQISYKGLAPWGRNFRSLRDLLIYMPFLYTCRSVTKWCISSRFFTQTRVWSSGYLDHVKNNYSTLAAPWTLSSWKIQLTLEIGRICSSSIIRKPAREVLINNPPRKPHQPTFQLFEITCFTKFHTFFPTC